MPHVHVLVALVVNVLRVRLVKGIVCKVDVVLVQILRCRRLVRAGCQAGQALLVDVQAQGLAPGQEDVYAQVEL